MNSLLSNLIQAYRSPAKARRLFLLDAAGAMVSAFLLGIVLVELEGFFGIPKSALYVLALIPCFFVLYDLYCFRFVRSNLGLYLKGIAVLNLAYCVLSLGFAIYHAGEITIFGWVYLVGEILIVVGLGVLEFLVAGQMD
ncbi:MAG: hypothetical protein AAF570_14480 [Bacteroidota bacterium]